MISTNLFSQMIHHCHILPGQHLLPKVLKLCLIGFAEHKITEFGGFFEKFVYDKMRKLKVPHNFIGPFRCNTYWIEARVVFISIRYLLTSFQCLFPMLLFSFFMLLKVLSSLLPVLITWNFVANADSQGALRISPCRNQTIIQLQIYSIQENKKEIFILKIYKVI